MRKIPYGVSSFPLIRREDYLYVDKTHFIKEVEKTKTLIHLRPRRFGKSLFLSMLDSYYDLANVDKFDDLFCGLYIHKNPTKNQNNYYMLRLNFSGIQNVREDDLEIGFLDKVKDGVGRFIDRYNLNIQIEESPHAATVLRSLLKQFKKLELAHKIYILIDEYDHFTNAVLSGDGEEFLTLLKRGGFVRSFYEVIKENAELEVVERIFITGVMSVTLDCMTSGFNIDTNITTDRRFTDVMGFSAAEVKDVLKMTFFEAGEEDNPIQLTPSEQAEVYQIFVDNYNGYLFSEESEVTVFNSTLIMYYLKHYLTDKLPLKNLIDKNLNQNSATIDSIVSLKNREQNYKIIEEVIDSKVVDGALQPFIDINTKFDKNDLITLLFNIGMITIKGFDMITQFKMPNKIIENIYLQYLSELLQKQSDYILDVAKQQEAIIEVGRKGEIRALTALVSEFLTHTSGRNTQRFDEKYIKLAYMMILVFSNQFVIYDEFPALQGFNDLFIQKAPNSTARYEVLIELKYIKKGDTTDAKIEKKLADGICQIEEYMKDERLVKRESLKKYVVVFSGFDAVMLEEL